MEFWANIEHQLRYNKNLSPQIISKTSERPEECARLSSVLDAQMQAIKDMIDNA